MKKKHYYSVSSQPFNTISRTPLLHNFTCYSIYSKAVRSIQSRAMAISVQERCSRTAAAAAAQVLL